MPLTDEVLKEIAVLSADHTAGATLLLDRTLAILRMAAAAGSLPEAAAAVCRSQPSMAPIWNAAVAALADQRDPGRLERFEYRRQRATAALTRFAVPVLLPSPARPLRLLTLSSSGAVLAVVRALRAHVDLQVACGEGRPLYEGRLQAAALTAAGASVRLVTDAGLGALVDGADAVIVGADAVGSHGFINKSGTRMLAAAAQNRGVAVYVLATSDKLAAPTLWPHLTIHLQSPDEVWDAPATHVVVENRYFEVITLDLVTAVITEMGVLGVDMLPSACASLDTAETRKALAELLQSL